MGNFRSVIHLRGLSGPALLCAGRWLVCFSAFSEALAFANASFSRQGKLATCMSRCGTCSTFSISQCFTFCKKNIVGGSCSCPTQMQSESRSSRARRLLFSGTVDSHKGHGGSIRAPGYCARAPATQRVSSTRPINKDTHIPVYFLTGAVYLKHDSSQHRPNRHPC